MECYLIIMENLAFVKLFKKIVFLLILVLNLLISLLFHLKDQWPL